jgi:hypothetical protein
LQWVEKKYGSEFAAKCKALPAYQEATADGFGKEANKTAEPKNQLNGRPGRLGGSTRRSTASTKTGSTYSK